MRYLILLPLVALVSCESIAQAVKPIVEIAKDPEVQSAATAVASDALGGNWVGALYGIGVLITAMATKKAGAAVIDKLKDSEPGKLL